MLDELLPPLRISLGTPFFCSIGVVFLSNSTEPMHVNAAIPRVGHWKTLGLTTIHSQSIKLLVDLGHLLATPIRLIQHNWELPDQIHTSWDLHGYVRTSRIFTPTSEGRFSYSQTRLFHSSSVSSSSPETSSDIQDSSTRRSLGFHPCTSSNPSHSPLR